MHFELAHSPQAVNRTSCIFNREVDSYAHTHATQRYANCTKFIVPDHLVALDSDAPSGVIELFYSFRSPYSQLILDRVLYLCVKFNKKLLMRPLVPMVARKLSVPFSKAFYIMTDAVREASVNWSIPFGTVADPG